MVWLIDGENHFAFWFSRPFENVSFTSVDNFYLGTCICNVPSTSDQFGAAMKIPHSYSGYGGSHFEETTSHKMTRNRCF